MGKPEKTDPWRVPLAVLQIPESGLHRELDADEAVRKAMAEVAGLREVLSAHASLDVTPKGGGRFHVAGNVSARVGQNCVVTLEPIESDIDEPIDLIFAPPEQIPELAALVDAAGGDEQIPDPPEPIVNGTIDLGRLATDALFLGIDPYPRKAYAVFEHEVTPPDPEDHPFAALKTLKTKPKKPKRQPRKAPRGK